MSSFVKTKDLIKIDLFFTHLATTQMNKISGKSKMHLITERTQLNPLRN